MRAQASPPMECLVSHWSVRRNAATSSWTNLERALRRVKEAPGALGFSGHAFGLEFAVRFDAALQAASLPPERAARLPIVGADGLQRLKLRVGELLGVLSLAIGLGWAAPRSRVAIVCARLRPGPSDRFGQSDCGRRASEGTACFLGCTSDGAETAAMAGARMSPSAERRRPG